MPVRLRGQASCDAPQTLSFRPWMANRLGRCAWYSARELILSNHRLACDGECSNRTFALGRRSGSFCLGSLQTAAPGPQTHSAQWYFVRPAS